MTNFEKTVLRWTARCPKSICVSGLFITNVPSNTEPLWPVSVEATANLYFDNGIPLIWEKKQKNRWMKWVWTLIQFWGRENSTKRHTILVVRIYQHQKIWFIKISEYGDIQHRAASRNVHQILTRDSSHYQNLEVSRGHGWQKISDNRLGLKF